VKEGHMDVHIVVPLALFACVTYGLKAVMDAMLRYRLLRAVVSSDVIRAVLEGEDHQRKVVALRWGILSSSLALGFGLIALLGWKEISAGVIAILAAAIGLGNLVLFAVIRRV
jgi:hypothetical protein